MTRSCATVVGYMDTECSDLQTVLVVGYMDTECYDLQIVLQL